MKYIKPSVLVELFKTLDTRSPVVSVVRCKDCIYDGMMLCPVYYAEAHGGHFINRDHNFYCANGVSKDE